MYKSVLGVLQSLCVLFCKKCEADIVRIVMQILANVLLLECKVLDNCVILLILMFMQSKTTVSTIFKHGPVFQNTAHN